MALQPVSGSIENFKGSSGRVKEKQVRKKKTLSQTTHNASTSIPPLTQNLRVRIISYLLPNARGSHVEECTLGERILSL